MSFVEWIIWLNQNAVCYDVCEYGELKQIYVYAKKEYILRKKHPRKYKDLYVPYMRLSRFEMGERLYVRDNDWVEWRSAKEVKNQILKSYV